MSKLRPAMASVALLLGISGASAEERENYPRMAAISAYRLPSREAEITLARSAAPASISDGAEVLVLGSTGYETAIDGKNGFTCLVERSWGADFDDPEFWNPRIRSPVCFNAAAVKSVLPSYRLRTTWVLDGASRSETLRRTRESVASGSIGLPAPGSMCYMMSKDAYLGDKVAGHWHPHLMFYLPHIDAAAWGAELKGSPVFGGPLSAEPASLFLVPVPWWSDGSPGPTSH